MSNNKLNLMDMLKMNVANKILCFIFLFMFGITRTNAAISDTSSNQVRIVKNSQVQVTVHLESNNLYFEIVRGKVKYRVTAVNEIGKISFSNSKTILSYLGNAFSKVDYILHKTEFLLFPVQDENGKIIYYRIALDLENGSSTSALPYILMRGQFALFNQKTAKMLIYEQIKQENNRTKKMYYVTNFNIYHLDKSEKENYREFYSTEKSVGVSLNLTPLALKVRMMDLLIDFMPNYTIENYFR